MNLNMRRRLGFGMAALVAIALAGCGGGGGGEAAAPQTDPPPAGGSNPPPPPPPLPTIGSAELSWMPPTENTDGSSIADLAGYEIRYGRSSGELTERINLTNPSLNRYLIENLEAGTWYFAVAAINSQGVSSTLSNVASKTI